MGQHDNYHNENYAFEENFKVPFLILDFRKDKMEALTTDLPTSHLALPATILDFAQFNGKTSFLANSMLKPAEEMIYLIQPYSGTLLGSIRWPWK